MGLIFTNGMNDMQSTTAIEHHFMCVLKNAIRESEEKF
jgi:hypothetical protein